MAALVPPGTAACRRHSASSSLRPLVPHRRPVIALRRGARVTGVRGEGARLAHALPDAADCLDDTREQGAARCRAVVCVVVGGAQLRMID